jgi:hypothetical protein
MVQTGNIRDVNVMKNVVEFENRSNSKMVCRT